MFSYFVEERRSYRDRDLVHAQIARIITSKGEKLKSLSTLQRYDVLCGRIIKVAEQRAGKGKISFNVNESTALHIARCCTAHVCRVKIYSSAQSRLNLYNFQDEGSPFASGIRV